MIQSVVRLQARAALASVMPGSGKLPRPRKGKTVTTPLPAFGKVWSIHRILGCLCYFASLSLGVASGEPMATYTLTHSKVSGSIGGTSFTDSELEIQYTLSDTGLLTDFNGGAPANGGFVRSPSFPGDQLAFTITGGGLPSPVSGTLTSADQFQVAASTASNTGALLFMSPSVLPYFSFQVPGTVPATIPTLDRLSQSVSFTVNQAGNPGWISSAQDPPSSGNYLGGAAIDNPVSFASTAGTLVIPQAQTLYNGSWTTVATVPEPATVGLALIAGGYFLVARARRGSRQ